MLVLSRKTSERILIGDDIVVQVIRIGPTTVRLGFAAPRGVAIVREEIAELSNLKFESSNCESGQLQTAEI